MGEVIKLNAALDPDVVLEEAKGQYQNVFIIGYDHDGLLDIRASLDFDCKSVVFAFERFKFNLMNGDYTDE